MASNLTGTRVFRDKGDNGKIYFDVISHEEDVITLAHWLLPCVTETVHPSKIWDFFFPNLPASVRWADRPGKVAKTTAL